MCPERRKIMIRELYKFMDKTFENGCEPPEEAIQLLVEGEEVMYSFETKAKDKALFTNKRLMVMDKGSRKKIYSIPYSEVVVWSSEEYEEKGLKYRFFEYRRKLVEQ